MIPHLVHIGFPKTGSTTLRRWFAAHPEVAYAEGGLGGYRGASEIAAKAAAAAFAGEAWQEPRARVTSAETLATPHADAGRAAIDYDRVRVEPIAEAQERVSAELYALFPEALILIVTRGFAGALVSAYSQYVRTGGVLAFEQFCEPPRPGAPRFEQVFDYDRLIALYEARFGSERVLVLPYEQLRDAPRDFFGAIEARLGLSIHPAPAEAANVSLPPAAMAWHPRIARRLRRLPGAASLYRRLVASGRADALAAALQALRPRPLLSEEAVPAEVLARFAPGAERLRARSGYGPYLSAYGAGPRPPSARAEAG